MRESFVIRILASILLLLALPLLAASFVLFEKNYTDTMDAGQEDLMRIAEVRNNNLLHIKPFSESYLPELAFFLTPSMTPFSSEKMTKTLQEVAALEKGRFTLAILGVGKGDHYTVLAASDPRFLHDQVISYYALPSIAQGGFVQAIHVALDAHQCGTPYFYAAQAILDGQGKLLGILFAFANIQEEITRILEAGQQLHPKISVALLQRDSIVFAATDPSLIGRDFMLREEKREEPIPESAKNISPEGPIELQREERAGFYDFTWNDDALLGYFWEAQPKEFGVTIVTYFSKRQFFTGQITRFLGLYGLYGLVIFLGALMAYLLSTWISGPWQRFASLMRKVGQGNLSQRFQKERLGFEVNVLGDIFNHTLDALFESVQREEEYRVTKETFQKEIEIGHEVQRQLLPQQMPKERDLEFAASYLSSFEVGGDFHDVVEKGDKLFVVVADAASKGVHACLYALAVRSLLRAFIALYDDVGEILVRTNNFFCKDAADSGMFVTVLLGCFDCKTKELSYYSCGHVPAYVRREDGTIDTLSHTGMAMGLKEWESYRPEKIQLYAGDLLFFYTDGAIDFENENFQHFTERRLKNCLRQRSWFSAQQVVDGVHAELKSFIGDTPQEEEATLLAMKLLS